MNKDTSWENSAQWYDQIVGKEGHYYHEHVILPKLEALLGKNPPSILDLCCGQGVLARRLPQTTRYMGIDGSRSLIAMAKKRGAKCSFSFYCHNLMEPLELKGPSFSHATCVLALQNLENPLLLLKTAHRYLEDKGTLILVLNHPCFRIPRQSHWTVDEKKKLQSRTVDRYMTPLKIPIHTNPGKAEGSQTTFSFHQPLSFYMHALKEAGFWVLDLEEWCSDKRSQGKNASQENRARQEFPLFLTIVAQKSS